MNEPINNGRSVASVLSDMGDDLKRFAETRIVMLKAEIREQLKTLKIAAPLAAGSIALLATAYLLLTMSIVALVFAILPDNAFRWCLAFLAVGILWSIAGTVAAYLAKRELETKGLLPNKTIRVLKGDKIWIQSELRRQI